MSSKESILVAVGGSGRGTRAVDMAVRLAEALDAPWHAIFIETPRSARDPGNVERAADALAHAAQLGATVSREPGARVADGLIAHLNGAPADHLVIGASSGMMRPWTFGRPLLRDVLTCHPSLTVHLVPQQSGNTASAPRVELTGPTPSFRSYAIALGLVLATVVVCELLRVVTGGRPLSLLFLFPVITAAARFGLRPALLAVFASVISFDLFLLEPLLHLEPLAPVNLVLWIALGAIAVYTSIITDALRSRVALSDRSAQESARIVTFAQMLTRVSTWQETAQAVCDEFAATMDAQTLMFREQAGVLVRAGAYPPDTALGPIDRGALEWCWANGEPAGAGTHMAAIADWRFEPLKTSLGVLAVLALSRADGRDPIRADRRVLFTTLVSQAALAHERLVLEDNLRAGATGI